MDCKSPEGNSVPTAGIYLAGNSPSGNSLVTVCVCVFVGGCVVAIRIEK